MGISGLLPFLQNSSKKCNVRDFKGSTVAVDAYCWLHKGAFSCADKLVLKEHTTMHVSYCLKYINMLLANEIKPILVFDGCNLPSKSITEDRRRQKRDANRRKGMELMRAGKVSDGRRLLRQSVDICHSIALQLISECRKMGVDCIVAPHEADAQLAYFSLIGLAQLVITEDSDLLVFGCHAVFFKMDVNGNGVLVERNQLHLSMGVRPDLFSIEKFRLMCILSGCDYLDSLSGIGLSKACKFVTRTSESNITAALDKLAANLNMWSLQIPDDYRQGVVDADRTFRCQLVYDPFKRQQVPLTDPLPGEEAVGTLLDPPVAFQLAIGNLDPRDLSPLSDWNPDQVINDLPASSLKRFQSSIWLKNSNGLQRVNVGAPLLFNKTKPIILRGKTAGQKITADVKLSTSYPLCQKDEAAENYKEAEDLLKLYCTPTLKRKKCDIPEDNYQKSRYFVRSPVFDENGCVKKSPSKQLGSKLKRNIFCSQENSQNSFKTESTSNDQVEVESQSEETDIFESMGSVGSNLPMTNSESSGVCSTELEDAMSIDSEGNSLTPSISPKAGEITCTLNEQEPMTPLRAFNVKNSAYKNKDSPFVNKVFSTTGTSESIFFSRPDNQNLSKKSQRIGLSRKQSSQSSLTNFGFKVRPKVHLSKTEAS